MPRVEVLAGFVHPTVADLNVARGSLLDLDDATAAQLNNEGKVAYLEPFTPEPPEPAAPPAIDSPQATGVTGTSATIQWSVAEECTDMHVDHGLDTSYGTSQPAFPESGSGNVVCNLAGLERETEHHYRISVTGAGGTTTSDDLTFTTTA